MSSSSAFLRFTNLMLLDPHGLPGRLPSHPPRDSMLPRHSLSNHKVSALGLRTYVNLVYGNMTALDRTAQHIIAEDNKIVKYDLLILLCGTQFQSPKVALDPSDATVPKNLFLINDEVDAELSLKAITSMMSLKGDLIVYGHCLEAYACIKGLLEAGISARRIDFVEPLPDSDGEVSFFNNADVDNTISYTFADLGVKVYFGFSFTDWEVDEETNWITKAMFVSKLNTVRLAVRAFFCFGSKMVKRQTYLALMRSHLVYDGFLVIDNKFRTNDPNILAAGPMTKYSRRYHADRFKHCYYNSEDVARLLANHVRALFDPVFDVSKMKEEEPPEECLVPEFTSPLVDAAQLPGNWNYLHVRKPGPVMPLETALGKPNYGTVLQTGDFSDGPDYFRLHFNSCDTVETITCLSKKEFDTDNLITLYGKHQSLLNNILHRFKEDRVPDLFAYFQQPWCLPLFYDGFADLQAEIRELFKTSQDNKYPILETYIKELLEKQQVFEVDQLLVDDAKKEFVKQKLLSEVESRVLGFLSCSRDHLPMFALPDIVDKMVRELKESTLYNVA